MIASEKLVENQSELPGSRFDYSTPSTLSTFSSGKEGCWTKKVMGYKALWEKEP